MRNCKSATDFRNGQIHPSLCPTFPETRSLLVRRLFFHHLGVAVAVPSAAGDGAKHILGGGDGTVKRVSLPVCAGRKRQARVALGEGARHALREVRRGRAGACARLGADSFGAILALSGELLEGNIARVLGEKSATHFFLFETCANVCVCMVCVP